MCVGGGGGGVGRLTVGFLGDIYIYVCVCGGVCIVYASLDMQICLYQFMI